MFDVMPVLNFFSRIFDLIQSVANIQLILVLLLSIVLFGTVLLNKTKYFNLSERGLKTLTTVVSCLVFSAMVVGAFVVFFDLLVFPFLYNFFWVA